MNKFERTKFYSYFEVNILQNTFINNSSLFTYFNGGNGFMKNDITQLQTEEKNLLANL